MCVYVHACSKNAAWLAHPPSDQDSPALRPDQDPPTPLPTRPQTRLSCCCPPALRAAPLRPLSDPSFILALATFSVGGVE